LTAGWTLFGHQPDRRILPKPSVRKTSNSKVLPEKSFSPSLVRTPRVRSLTSSTYEEAASKGRMKILMHAWGFRLPMASAILSVPYPNVFTVYDMRVCETLGAHSHILNIQNFDRLWDRYQEFIEDVRRNTPRMTLRSSDKWLWGRSFHDQLSRDLSRRFIKQS